MTYLFWVIVVWIAAVIVVAVRVEHLLRALRAKRAKAEESPIDLLELDRADVQAHYDKLQLRMERDRIRWPILHSAPPQKQSAPEDIPPREEGWANYVLVRPRQDLVLQFMRKNSSLTTRFVAMPREFPGEVNPAGLYWRLTGIAKMQIEQRSNRGISA